MNLIKQSFCICVIFFTVSTVFSQSIRYKDSVFTVSTPQTVVYRTANDYLGSVDTLKMDLYMPSGDTMAARPVIMVLYGGSFLQGSRTDAYIINYCMTFTKRGYVAVAIDYRLGVDFLNISKSYPAAIYRAVQDSRAAVRFLRSKAVEYKLDVNKVFGCGYSAGSITVLHHAYLDQNQTKGVFDSTGLGLLDAGEYLDQAANLNAVVNLSGFIGDSNWISKKEIPIISFHGTVDTVVPYKSGYPLNITALPIVYGSAIIDTEAQRNGVPHLLVKFEGKGHTYDQEMIVSVMKGTLTFLYPYCTPPLAIFDRIKNVKVSHTASTRLTNTFNLTGRMVRGIKGSQLLINSNGMVSGKVISGSVR